MFCCVSADEQPEGEDDFSKLSCCGFFSFFNARLIFQALKFTLETLLNYKRIEFFLIKNSFLTIEKFFSKIK